MRTCFYCYYDYNYYYYNLIILILFYATFLKRFTTVHFIPKKGLNSSTLSRLIRLCNNECCRFVWSHVNFIRHEVMVLLQAHKRIDPQIKPLLFLPQMVRLLRCRKPPIRELDQSAKCINFSDKRVKKKKPRGS